jgi:soluble lytic murein transglycosylase-like protein
MDIDRLARTEPTVLYRKYLFRIGNFQEWVGVWIGSFHQFVLGHMKKCCAVLAVLLNLFVYTVAADGTGHNLLVSNLVFLMDKDIDVYARAYKDIGKLAASIGTSAGVTNADERFVYAFLITKWSRQFGFDPLEVAAVALTESQFNPKAVSPKDARGLMQIHRPTWQMDNYFNTEENIKKAMQILYMYRNSSPDSYLKRYYGDTGEEGTGYVKKVKGNYKRLARIYKETLRVP